MTYSVQLPRRKSPQWKILDDRGDIVFSGSQQICEEFLDLADSREAASGRPPRHATNEVTTRLSIFGLAAGLLRRFWGDSSGEVRVSGDLPVIFLMMVVTICLSSQFVSSAIVQQASLIRGASVVTCGSQHWGTCAGTQGEASCANSRTLDMACDAVDDSY
jgi:hypothetical protein